MKTVTQPATTEMIERVKRLQGRGETMLRRLIAEVLQAYLKGELDASTAAETFLKIDVEIPEKPDRIEDILMRLALIDEPEHGAPTTQELQQILRDLQEGA